MEAIFSYQRDPEDDFYAILGCDELSTTDQIMAEFKSRALQCHPDKHPDDPDAAKKFACLQRAKGTLCDIAKRADYDAWRRSGIAIPFDEWMARKDSVQTSLHWAMKTKKEPMLEPAPSASQDIQDEEDDWMRLSYWRREPASEVLRKFRNYEI